jgi:hypothetical protein
MGGSPRYAHELIPSLTQPQISVLIRFVALPKQSREDLGDQNLQLVGQVRRPHHDARRSWNPHSRAQDARTPSPRRRRRASSPLVAAVSQRLLAAPERELDGVTLHCIIVGLRALTRVHRRLVRPCTRYVRKCVAVLGISGYTQRTPHLQLSPPELLEREDAYGRTVEGPRRHCGAHGCRRTGPPVRRRRVRRFEHQGLPRHTRSPSFPRICSP